jgi:flagellar biosynthesis anti-sigma factor FlgM
MRIPSRLYQRPEVQNRTDQAGKGEGAKDARTEDVSQSPRAREDDVRVEISPRARSVAGANAMDIEKVERLRSLVDAGGLQINAERIANRIVDSGG